MAVKLLTPPPRAADTQPCLPRWRDDPDPVQIIAAALSPADRDADQAELLSGAEGVLDARSAYASQRGELVERLDHDFRAARDPPDDCEGGLLSHRELRRDLWRQLTTGSHATTTG